MMTENGRRPETAPRFIHIFDKLESAELASNKMLPSCVFTPEMAQQLQAAATNASAQGFNGYISGILIKTALLLTTLVPSNNNNFSVQKLILQQGELSSRVCVVREKMNNFLRTYYTQIEQLKKSISEGRQLGQASTSPLSKLQKLYFSTFRTIFVSHNYDIHKLVYFPAMDLQIFKANVDQHKYYPTRLKDQSTKITNDPQVQATFGHLALYPDQTKVKLAFIDRLNKKQCAQSSENSEMWQSSQHSQSAALEQQLSKCPRVGIWIRAKDITFKNAGEKQILNYQYYHLIWALIVDFLKMGSTQKTMILQDGEKKYFMMVLISPDSAKATFYGFTAKAGKDNDQWKLCKATVQGTSVQPFKQEFEFEEMYDKPIQTIFKDLDPKSLANKKQAVLRNQKNSNNKSSKNQFQVPSLNETFGRQDSTNLSRSEVGTNNSRYSPVSVQDQKDLQIKRLKAELQNKEKQVQIHRQLLFKMNSLQAMNMQFNPYMHHHPQAMQNMMGPVLPQMGMMPSPMMNPMQSHLMQAGMPMGMVNPMYPGVNPIIQSRVIQNQNSSVNGSKSLRGSAALSENSKTQKEQPTNKINAPAFMARNSSQKQRTPQPEQPQQASPIASMTLPNLARSKTAVLVRMDSPDQDEQEYQRQPNKRQDPVQPSLATPLKQDPSRLHTSIVKQIQLCKSPEFRQPELQVPKQVYTKPAQVPPPPQKAQIPVKSAVVVQKQEPQEYNSMSFGVYKKYEFSMDQQDDETENTWKKQSPTSKFQKAKAQNDSDSDEGDDLVQKMRAKYLSKS